MWQPEPGWERLATGPSSGGAWAARSSGMTVVVKRLVRPGPHDPFALRDPRHPGYWRRSADVALSGVVEESPGLRCPPAVDVSEDETGITVVTPWVDHVAHEPESLARALGRFATMPVPLAAWLARDPLGHRVAELERRGGWQTLARTPVADVADVLWRRRAHLLHALGGQPQVLQHGDPVPANLRGRSEEDVVAVDWSTLGEGPAGGDLGYLALSLRADLGTLVDAYSSGLVGVAGVSAEGVTLAARTVIAWTVLTRADWALSRVAGGEGPLGAKLRHPSVAPVLRAMQRHLSEILALCDSL